MTDFNNAPYLQGVRVLDFSNLTPGPFASQALADLSATVLKVERPGTGDLERSSVPAYFRASNRGKGSIAIDLRNPGGVPQAKELLADADVLIDGFRPSVMNRLGLGFEDPKVKALGIVHSEPCLHADIPIIGAPRVRRLLAPELDEDGDFVRTNGWLGLTERLEGR
jgi:hypothetical protein